MAEEDVLEQKVQALRRKLLNRLLDDGHAKNTCREDIIRYRGQDGSSKQIIRGIRNDQPDEGYGLGFTVWGSDDESEGYCLTPNLEIEPVLHQLHRPGGVEAVLMELIGYMGGYLSQRGEAPLFYIESIELCSGNRPKEIRHLAAIKILAAKEDILADNPEMYTRLKALSYDLLKSFDHAIAQMR